MKQHVFFSPLVLAWLSVNHAARADHFSIDLEAKAGDVSKSAKMDTAALGVKPRARGVLEARAGKPITVKWTVASTAKKGEVKDALIHFFVVKEEKAGQVAVPKLDKEVVVENALTMDFKPKDKTEGELTFQIDAPGNYLLRLETKETTSGIDGHEHFAALDVVVK
jgi:hypothetical protein